MKRLIHPEEVFTQVSEFLKQGKTIGFVPTMGALHQGHVALVRQAKLENDIVICSIFVNPLQFNRKEDLEDYPNRLSEDVQLLEKENCDILFTPQKETLYDVPPIIDYDFGYLGVGMEAKKRPGHFEGVVAVVKRLLEVILPTRAYFGEKDYQQLAIIRWAVKKFNLNANIISCKTIRNEKGLALSSRNFLLTDKERERASEIYETMIYCKENKENHSPEELKIISLQKLQKNFEPEYFEIADEVTLQPIKKWKDSQRPRVFVAAYLSKVRLIDNLSLIN